MTAPILATSLLILGEIFAGLALGAQGVAGHATPAEIYQDLRGQVPQPPWRIIGPNADEVFRSEPEGLRITLPGNRPQGQRDVVGIRGDLDLAGDFIITGTFELLSDKHPPNDSGMGVALQIASDQRFSKFARVGCFLLPNRGRVFIIQSWDKDSPLGQRDQKSRTEPTEARTGRLRLEREGSTLRFLAAEGLEDDFREIFRQEFGKDDIAIVRFIVNNHVSSLPVDARLVDLRVESNSLATTPGITSGSKGWLGAAMVIALVLFLSVAVSLVVLFRYRRRHRTVILP